MNVLSLFDGMSCGQIALHRAGIKVDNYFASEIKPHAIKVTQHNYPNTIQLGDVTKLDTSKLPKIDLLIGGSPCQDFSTLGKRNGLQGEKSGLFYEYVRVLNEIQPTYYLLENNANMPRDSMCEITKQLGGQYIEIDSALVSAQSRKRFYWSNIRNITLPEDKHLYIENLLLNGLSEIELVPYVKRKLIQIQEKYGYIPTVFNPYNNAEIKYKSPCLTAQGNSQTKSSSIITHKAGKYFMFSAHQWEQLQTLPTDYTFCVSEGKRKELIGDGWTVDVIAHIFSFLPEEWKKGETVG